MHIRRAAGEEADALSALALRAKAHWGYAAAQIEAWRASLAVSSETVLTRPTYVGELNGQIVGFYSLLPSASEWELDNLWVTPERMRCGFGRMLLAHALQTATDSGAACVLVDADPNAERFYASCGAKRTGEVPAPIEGQPGRVRPQLTFACMTGRGDR